MADDHGIDEALWNGSSWIGGIVLGLICWRLRGVIEFDTIMKREDEIDKLAPSRHDGDGKEY